MKITPRDYDALIDASNADKVGEIFQKTLAALENTVSQLPSHEAYIDRVCR